MHRNTALLIIFLGIFSAVVVGVNLGHIGQNQNTALEIIPTPHIPTVPTPTPIPLISFEMEPCGITLSYPATFTKVALENDATTFLDPASPIDATTVQCQNFLTKQYAKNATTSTVMIGSISATLYTPTAASGSALEKTKLYFRNTPVQKDVVISGSGKTFDSIISSLTIL